MLTSSVPTKPHFQVLDGLRGIAAVAVVIFHFMEFITPDYHDSFIAHAYLAVDFFFCLSGFVIAYAYDDKLGSMGVLTFLKRRLIRLHPLVVIGSIIGLLTFVFDPFSKLYSVYASQTLGMFLTSCLMIPFPLVRERYFNLFHLNPPTWTLFWEYLANVLYALVLVKLPTRVLAILTLIAAGTLFYEAHRSTYLAVGFGGDNFWGGGSRVFYSFLAGMLVYRSRWIIRTRLGFGVVGLLLLLTFLVPFSKGINWLVDPLLVVFYFPFLIALGAGTPVEPTLQRICTFSGDISYPLYMTHYPFLWIVLSYIEAKKPPVSELVGIMIVGVVLLILFAYIVLKFLDEPIRTYFNRR
ncbi:acyltransferase [Siphonobacter sp. BAB-5385]|uniref:acyltransferase family protein n=1 Tax=Siphonobacter sp. BAB-5385 TaxID=1864822 RepID=UPI000B9E16E4|nr:acyltransferase [Siphonobacter sp. BAB-5385]OZI09741.1 acyltransferase [Siphonobacter sp. BAB-5385]